MSAPQARPRPVAAAAATTYCPDTPAAAAEEIAACFAQHRTVLLAIAVKILAVPPAAEDVVADVMTHLLASGRRPQHPGSWRGYLSKAVANRALSMLRARVVEDRATNVLSGRAEVYCLPSAEQLVLRDADNGRIHQALRHLPKRQRQVMILRYWGDLPESQIAARLGISLGAVKSHSSRARAELLRLLSGEDEQHDRRPAPPQQQEARPGGGRRPEMRWGA
ncbi:RNA polymerase sigma factor [Nonomuraea sp. NPDC050536]|uniref:RNA polymerase sigma factor n=1 Tax=Nonomuraea sp. NPDC050536 TaxID=3364366 RepID=UPI0037C8A31E